MFARSDIKAVIDSWQGWLKKCHQSALPRDHSISLPDHQALAVMGVRRCGKSYVTALLTRMMAQKTFYMNFEDPFFIENNSVPILDEILSVSVEFSGTTPEILLFDEIHNVEGWERWARKVIDLKKFRLILTGSSAKMLSSELSTALTGRCLAKTVWPLSFKEYLQFKNLPCRDPDEHLGALRDYSVWGGFPEVVLASSETHKQDLLRQYLTDILYKDIIKRNEIRAARSLEQLVRYYLTNISSLHSYNSVRKAFGLNVETARDYTSFLQEAFLLFEVNRFHFNLKVQARDSKKIYAVDTGLRNINAASPNEDRGKLMENIVYIELRRREKEISYFKETAEVDFVLSCRGQPQEAIQVCYDDLREPTTWQREVEALMECLHKLKLRQGTILTLKREENLRREGKEISLKPLYRWLLEEDERVKYRYNSTNTS